ncbi:MAG: DNA mismatch repair endonuclease MutL [Candidatus Peregrinibacteria bacterium]|nr:DNA mismatch repair endonuclease MutL [Candidatus Peregrinibacteria bacterium]
MSIIKVLPESLINQIAAGEVVERPASVVKELVENSIDAGAKNIVVEMKDAGKSFIKIIDDGCGMIPEDLELALQRHATSKIRDEADLWKIKTMGFRGEALASISSVSKMIIRSKTVNDLAGTEIQSVGGEIKLKQEVGMPSGTQIEVYDLFFNTPARQKYLKQDSTELGHVTSILDMIALAHPELSFKLVHNDKVIFDLARSSDLISRVADIFGKATSEAMLPVFYGGSAFQIDGFIGKPLLSRSTSQHQYFFVNGRPIQHFLLANTIKTAFHSMLMENKKPVFILNIKIDPALIDVNVHPRKTEIRFEDQQSLIKVVYGCVKTALEKNILIPKGFTESQRYMSDSFPKDEVSGGESELGGFMKFGGSPVKQENFNFGMGEMKAAMNFSKDFIETRQAEGIQTGAVTEKRFDMKPIVQIFNSYIVAQNDSGLVLIDQHAAHERVRFEELISQFENQEKSVQPLLMALQMELSNEEVSLIKENMDIFSGLGFEIEPFGGNTFVIHAVPVFLAKENMEEVIKGVLDDILNQKNTSKMHGRREEMLTYMSCRSAIKFGQKLSLIEMQSLIMQMEKLQRPYTCPHGRPTMVSLTMDELGKMFGRK